MKNVHFSAELSGTPYEIGFGHGSKAKSYVLHSIEMYKEMFITSSGVRWDDAKTVSRKYIPYIKQYDPDILEEMKGLADGAGLDLEDILALNARSEVLMTMTPKASVISVDGCTNIAVSPERSSNGHTILGHNWDWKETAKNSIILLKIHQQNKPDILMITEAGIIGKFGVNEAGVGVAMNALSTPSDANGVPLHCILRGILNSSTLTEAYSSITRMRSACAANYMLASACGEIFDCERVPDDFELIYPTDSILAHANMITSEKLKMKYPDNMYIMGASTYLRHYRAGKLIRKYARVGPAEIKSVLSDHADYPDCICSHPHEARHGETVWCTVFNIVMDLTERSMEICAGNPCEGKYYKVTL
ncbi:MAG: C45 family autoproteolytic acyltransferase/hydrolase [Oscillospiraceae bacterium]